MTPLQRRVLQALLYEGIAVAVVAPTLAWVFDSPPLSALALTLATSAVALAWNYVYNALFERWEARQAVRGRSAARRLAHSAGFELGLVVLLVPLIAWWLDVALGVPLGYLYCDNDRLAEIMLAVGMLPPEDQDALLAALKGRLAAMGAAPGDLA